MEIVTTVINCIHREGEDIKSLIKTYMNSEYMWIYAHWIFLDGLLNEHGMVFINSQRMVILTNIKKHYNYYGFPYNPINNLELLKYKHEIKGFESDCVYMINQDIAILGDNNESRISVRIHLSIPTEKINDFKENYTLNRNLNLIDIT